MNNSINGVLGRGAAPTDPRSGGSRSTAAGSPEQAGTATGASGSDRVNLTESARAIRDSEQVQSAAPAVDAGKVAAIRQEIAEGRYNVSSEQIADRLLGIEQQLGGVA